jgi:hypothetical protein
MTYFCVSLSFMMIKTCCVNVLEIELTKWLGFMWFSLYNLWWSILVNIWRLHGKSNQWRRNILHGILCGGWLWRSILSHTIGSSLGWMGFQGFHDKHKCQSVTAYLGPANIWRGIHNIFINRHGKLTVMRFHLSLTKVNRHQALQAWPDRQNKNWRAMLSTNFTYNKDVISQINPSHWFFFHILWIT